MQLENFYMWVPSFYLLWLYLLLLYLLLLYLLFYARARIEVYKCSLTRSSSVLFNVDILQETHLLFDSRQQCAGLQQGKWPTIISPVSQAAILGTTKYHTWSMVKENCLSIYRMLRPGISIKVLPLVGVFGSREGIFSK